MKRREPNFPLGMMNEDSAEDIGNIIGKFVEADKGVDGSAIGRFLRIKVRMRIDKPVMRGFTLEDEEKQIDGDRMEQEDSAKEEAEEGRDWCRLEYEYLPDFCICVGS